MTQEYIKKIFEDTAYIRTSGTPEERKTAEYIAGECGKMGLDPAIEPFDVEMATVHYATLTIDGKEIPCKGYRLCGSGEVEAPLYYMTTTDKTALKAAKGKIVLLDTAVRYWLYQDLLEAGAVGFITYTNNANYPDDDIDDKELRPHIHKGNKLLGVNLNVKSAVEIIKNNGKIAKISISQEEYTGQSHNVILDMPGESEEVIVFSAHYDTTPLSQGAYDNMSGSVGLLGIAEYFKTHGHKRSLRFIWCGSEERGLLGSKAYVADHEEALENIVLNINLDMIGCTMGSFFACCTTEQKTVGYMEYFALEHGIAMKVQQDVYSSDSTPFADKGIPAISFARHSPLNVAEIHNRYDTKEIIKPENMLLDIDFISKFADRMANAVHCPVSRDIPENMKEKLDIYLNRKRK